MMPLSSADITVSKTGLYLITFMGPMCTWKTQGNNRKNINKIKRERDRTTY